MKNWLKVILLCSVGALSACHAYRYDDDYWQFPCERDRTGNVCVENATHRKINMEIGDTEFEVAAYSTICVDIYEGVYDYKGKQGLHRWRGDIPIYRCEQYFIRLDR